MQKTTKDELVDKIVLVLWICLCCFLQAIATGCSMV